MLTQFWAMASFQEVLTHAKNTDNHCWNAFMQYFECMVPKTLFMLPCFKKRKSRKFSNFSYPGSRKVLISVKIMISGQKCCCYLMQDSLKYLCIQFGYNWTKNKEMSKCLRFNFEIQIFFRLGSLGIILNHQMWHHTYCESWFYCWISWDRLREMNAGGSCD